MVTDVSREPAEYSDLEDGDSKLLCNNGNYLPNDMVSHPSMCEQSSKQLLESQILQ